MKITSQRIWSILMCAFLITMMATLGVAQEKPDEIVKKITTFLSSNEGLNDYSKNGYTSTFSGDFRLIPSELGAELNLAFPKHNFYIAKMKVLIDAPQRNYDLILITNAITKEVESFIWGNYWMIRPSNSFEAVLKGYQAKSKDDAIYKVKSLAKLIAFTSNGEIGDAKIQKGKVKVELIKGKGVFSVLEVEINKCLQFDRLTLTEPNGEKIKYFV